MTGLHTHTLDGCTPTPLAGYLKALGVLRLLASTANNATGEAADPTARGWWQNERFHLTTRLDRNALLRFFLEDYAPSPVISPWNRGSGFYRREGAAGVFDVETSATRKVKAIYESNNPRLHNLRNAIGTAKGILSDELETVEAPEGPAKAAFMDRYRSLASDEAAAWIDAALVTSGEKFDSAALLGSGGNDGNLDYSTAFHSAVLEVLTATEQSSSSVVLNAALFDRAMTGPLSGAISQFAPGGIAAANSGNGFSGETGSDSWSIILMLEGAISFAGTATTLGDVGRVRGSFPFTVSQSAGGSGAIGNDDIDTQRSYELWLPLWGRPVSCKELRVLLGEGRAHLGRERARDGLTFARAVASLGTSRGVGEFQRLAFEARYGNMFITVPAGRFHAPSHPRRSDPIADLDRHGWLANLRREGKNGPARARITIRQLEDALFDMTEASTRHSPQNSEDPSPNNPACYRATQKALMALGSVVSWLESSKEAREKVAPPPRLGSQWVRDANDDSPEFRVAAALASLGWNALSRAEEAVIDESAHTGQRADAENEDKTTSEAGGTTTKPSVDSASSLPKVASAMAAHLAPLDEATFSRPNWRWLETTSPTVVWSAASLERNMIAVLERRLIDQARRGLDDKPLTGASPARLEDVAAFLQGPDVFDGARCAALLAGLVWAQPAWLKPSRTSQHHTSIPFAYAAIKPLLTADRDLRRPDEKTLSRLKKHEQERLERRQLLPAGARLPIPPGLVARLRRDEISDAIIVALQRARASGLTSPFMTKDGAAAGFAKAVNSQRLAAALLIPVNDIALNDLMNRAYPKPADEGQPNTEEE